ncbi:MAG: response regulator transcription factor [Bacteroidetes bacterium]|nr:DNA-binding response regulator [Bacteroidota bacterium]MBV6461394.1 Transcriptional regulatory protein DegU [Flavobacteriales bacterium]WKZ75205.1 MAG: response regulator transcription factor [Vicingaceae bacterium]MCL4817429.1 response regulator transcription factor [Flavobacteriales bacterium]NOG96110.1 response regulator transcription factor [Bacteroidota bacterium]
MIIKVAILEDDYDANNTMESILNSNDKSICIGKYYCAEDAIEGLKNISPNVFLVDIHLPGKSGIEFIEIAKDKYPSVEFLVISAIEEDESLFKALQAGASGYLVKTIQNDKLFNAILDVVNGGSPMSNRIARKVINSFRQCGSNKAFQQLTCREQEILKYLADGFRYKEIASRIFLSTETVRTHIRNIYQKLQVNSRTEAINKVFKNRP